MAAKNVNQTVMRWLNGGVIKIDDSTDVHTIANIHDGALSFSPVMREPKYFKDRGVQQAPIEGDDTLGELTVEVNCGALKQAADTSLLELLIADGSSSTNLAKEYTSVIMEFPVSRGGTTGQRVTFTNCSVNAPPEWNLGQDYDKLKFTMRFRAQTLATY
jgi:hypothetical protein